MIIGDGGCLAYEGVKGRQLLGWSNSSRQNDDYVGGRSDEGPPGPIPNPEVKLVSADGTWGAAPWESKSLPTGFYRILHFGGESKKVNRKVDLFSF